MRGQRIILMAAVAALPLMAMPAAAQTAQQTPAVNDFGVEEIIVTARKTAERLQDAPLAVSVVSSQSIDRLGFSSITDLSRATAGLVFEDSLGRDGNRPVLRGQANILGSSGVAFFIDGIYFNGSIADFDVDTIARLEVAKGPQSALYGRNTYSGAINIISKAPAETWGGRIQADISEGMIYDITGSVSGPIAPGLGVFLGGRYFKNEGQFTNAFDNSKLGIQETKSGYGMLKYNNGGIFRASLRGNYNSTRDEQPATVATSSKENNCIFSAAGVANYFCGTIQPRQSSSDWTRMFRSEEDVGNSIDTFNGGLSVDIDLSDNLTLTSLTGYNSRIQSQQLDGDYSPGSFQTFAIFAFFPIGGGRYSGASSAVDFGLSSRSKDTNWSQELRLDYKTDRARVMLGGFYFSQHSDIDIARRLPANFQTLINANLTTAFNARCAITPGCTGIVIPSVTVGEDRSFNRDKIRNIAVFGTVQYDLTDALSITAEGRYQEERYSGFAQTATVAAGNVGLPTIGEVTFKKFTPRVTFDYKVTPDNLLYAVYAEGQKPGGLNSAAAIRAGIVGYGPEDAQSFEIGSKNTFLNGGLVLNLAMFHNKIRGYQLTQPVLTPNPPTINSATANAGDARINGLELEVTARPTRELTLTANYALADSKFTSGLDPNQGTLDDLSDDGLANCSVGDRFPTVAGCQPIGSIVGKRIPRAPTHSLFVDLDFRKEIGTSGWQAFAGMNAYLVSNGYAQVHNLAGTGGSLTSDIRAGVQNDNFRVQFYVRNVFNEDAVLQLIRYADANNAFARNFLIGPRPPRRFGVIAEMKF